jgi:uncharacterized protein (UPF0332 family)
MNFDWTEYYTLAKEILGIGSSIAGLEAKQRSAVSRAYYAAFHIAKAYIVLEQGEQYLRKGLKVHERVIEFFYDRQDQLSQEIARNLVAQSSGLSG